MIVGIFSNPSETLTAWEVNRFLQDQHVTRPDQLVRLEFRAEGGRYTVLVVITSGDDVPSEEL
jgi:hypothetical protein